MPWSAMVTSDDLDDDDGDADSSNGLATEVGSILDSIICLVCCLCVFQLLLLIGMFFG